MNVDVSYHGVNLPLVDRPGQPCLCVFGVRKSGSSILNSIIEALAKHAEMNYVDVAGTLFRGGVSVASWANDPAFQFLLRPGNVLAGFRDFPQGMARGQNFASVKKLLLVRDPRDALVSEYFSNAKTHHVPESGQSREEMLKLRTEAVSTDIDAFVLGRANLMQDTMLGYRTLIGDSSALILRYEDVILNKRALISMVCKHFEWDCPDDLLGHILGWADVVPVAEDQSNFVRKVVPGDHVEKLMPQTISRLNEILRESIGMFGYSI